MKKSKNKIVIPKGYNPATNTPGKISSNITGEGLKKDFDYGELDGLNGNLVKLTAEEIINQIKNNPQKNHLELIEHLQYKFNLKDIPTVKIEDTLWHKLTEGEHLGQNIQGFKIVGDDKGNNKKKIPHIGFSSDLDYLDGFINRLILKLENLGLISINIKDKK
jgi:hypothetical protein